MLALAKDPSSHGAVRQTILTSATRRVVATEHLVAFAFSLDGHRRVALGADGHDGTLALKKTVHQLLLRKNETRSRCVSVGGSTKSSKGAEGVRTAYLGLRLLLSTARTMRRHSIAMAVLAIDEAAHRDDLSHKQMPNWPLLPTLTYVGGAHKHAPSPHAAERGHLRQRDRRRALRRSH